MIQTKVCKLCKEEKEIAAFYPRMGRCKSCHCSITRQWALQNLEKVRKAHQNWRKKPGSSEKERIATRRWQSANPDKVAVTRLRSQVKLYGLSLETYTQMEQQQSGCCFICHKVPNRRLDIDHNHTTGVVRKLLCHGCNTLIGSAGESVDLLQKAITYLQSHSQLI